MPKAAEYGYGLKVIVETKLATNKRFLKLGNANAIYIEFIDFCVRIDLTISAYTEKMDSIG